VPQRFFVGKKFRFLGYEERRFGRQTSGRLVFAGQFLGFDLAGFDVRLVKRVDAND